MDARTYLKNKILVQDCGGAEFKTAGILLYVEDLKRSTNPAEKGGRPKDIFEIGSNLNFHWHRHLTNLNNKYSIPNSQFYKEHKL